MVKVNDSPAVQLAEKLQQANKTRADAGVVASTHTSICPVMWDAAGCKRMDLQ